MEQPLPYKEITSDELDLYYKQNPNALLLDVRTQEEWDESHHPHAIHIVLDDLEQELSERIPHKDQCIVSICARGGRSAIACGILAQHGYTKLLNVDGGMLAYSGTTVST